MNGFVDLHGGSITGVINTFDRVIFKGHLNGFFPDGAFGRYLSRRGVLLKDVRACRKKLERGRLPSAMG
jgi:hypothetical protein